MTDAFRDEHEVDPHDVADAYFLLDDGEAVLGLAPCCGKVICCCDNDRELLKPLARSLRGNPTNSRRAVDR